MCTARNGPENESVDDDYLMINRLDRVFEIPSEAIPAEVSARYKLVRARTHLFMTSLWAARTESNPPKSSVISLRLSEGV